jgi:hypothetical protein
VDHLFAFSRLSRSFSSPFAVRFCLGRFGFKWRVAPGTILDIRWRKFHKPLVKKKRARAASVDEMPPPPPPMLTIRVDREFEDDYETLEWNILDDARERGMVAEWPTGPDISNTLAEPEHPVAGPSQPPLPVPLDGNGLDANLMDDDALAIAARLEAK